MASLERSLPVPVRSANWNPTAAELRTHIAMQHGARATATGSYSITTRVKSRIPESTYILPGPDGRSKGPVLPPEAVSRIQRIQDEYLATKDVFVLDGLIGGAPPLQCAVQLVVEQAYPHLAAMQQILHFPGAADTSAFLPPCTVIVTPDCVAPGFPGTRVVLVDLATRITRILGSDYFGEVKKAGFRHWNAAVYDAGGLALHAGCKVIPTNGDESTVLIIGMSGTGKTTTTFADIHHSLPVQDDFVGLLPGGTIVGGEHGCFAKVTGLDPDMEQAIYHATLHADTLFENVSLDTSGMPDFQDDSLSDNGRATFALTSLPAFRDARTIGAVRQIVILNRSSTILPAIAQCTPVEGAAYFMLGETEGTAAGGVTEDGKFLHVPGTNPFFPYPDALQGNRFTDIVAGISCSIVMCNTGSIGGPDTGERKKISVDISTACLTGAIDESISWTRDSDFGYNIATSCPGIDDMELLAPHRLYERTHRESVYEQLVTTLLTARQASLAQYPDLDPRLLDALHSR
ncbi:MAG: phosphoenolpyruvate carboxykinase (ATP) [Candidatus Dormibacteria bacterium]